MRLRLRQRWRKAAFFAASFLFAAIALLPMRVALGALGAERAGLAAQDAVGTVWFGALKDARLGEVALGDVTARLRFFPLFLGRARVDLERLEGGGRLKGAITLSRHGFGIDDATGALPAPEIPAVPAAMLELNDVTVRFADGLCRHAEGRVTARLPAPSPAVLAGEARCEGPMLLLPLASQAGRDAVTLRVGADGRYRGQASFDGATLPFQGTF